MLKSNSQNLPILKIFILAGEASGDQIGADLIGKLSTQANLAVSGVGGRNMLDRGMQSLFPITDLSVMGGVDVMLRLPLLLWRVRQTIQHIVSTNPQIVVLIDSQVFSNLVAKGLKKRGFDSPILLYVAPTVWVYKPERAAKIVPLYDEILSILPFEPAIIKTLKGPSCQYVGHPVLERSLPVRTPTIIENILLLPGSRAGEIRRHLPLLKDSVHSLFKQHPNLKFSLLTLPHLLSNIVDETSTWLMDVHVTDSKEMRRELFKSSDMALTVSGTATLELAVAKIPMVVIYIMDAMQVRMNKTIQAKYISLPNCVLNAPIVPDLLMEQADAARVIAAAHDLMNNPASRQKQMDGFLKLEKQMEAGTPDYPRQNPAHCVLSHVQLDKRP